MLPRDFPHIAPDGLNGPRARRASTVRAPRKQKEAEVIEFGGFQGADPVVQRLAFAFNSAAILGPGEYEFSKVGMPSLPSRREKEELKARANQVLRCSVRDIRAIARMMSASTPLSASRQANGTPGSLASLLAVTKLGSEVGPGLVGCESAGLGSGAVMEEIGKYPFTPPVPIGREAQEAPVNFMSLGE